MNFINENHARQEACWALAIFRQVTIHGEFFDDHFSISQIRAGKHDWSLPKKLAGNCPGEAAFPHARRADEHGVFEALIEIPRIIEAVAQLPDGLVLTDHAQSVWLRWPGRRRRAGRLHLIRLLRGHSRRFRSRRRRRNCDDGVSWRRTCFLYRNWRCGWGNGRRRWIGNHSARRRRGVVRVGRSFF